MVCFSNDNAVNQVLARSPNLCRSTLYGHIYVKRDLPRSQRPSANRREVNVLAEKGVGVVLLLLAERLYLLQGYTAVMRTMTITDYLILSAYMKIFRQLVDFRLF